ncbi:hypothetical protein M0R45_035216 [Rubus argutus]|uniref:Uncharacterized protein n=1 Tax=Rubus argutus TaxID=59490 RepID=A0AAW1VTB1_RUBAR
MLLHRRCSSTVQTATIVPSPCRRSQPWLPRRLSLDLNPTLIHGARAPLFCTHSRITMPLSSAAVSSFLCPAPPALISPPPCAQSSSQCSNRSTQNTNHRRAQSSAITASPSSPCLSPITMHHR